VGGRDHRCAARPVAGLCRLLAQASNGLVHDITQTQRMRSRPGIDSELHRLVNAVLAA
jgi:hypothetical protein